MSSLENIYPKMMPGLDPASLTPSHQEPPGLPQPRVIGREVAHELNNILTIVQAYTDRMLMKHGENPALRPDLLLILENTRRAVSVIRQATPRKPVPAPVAV